MNVSFEQLPKVTQMIFGGEPYRSNKNKKALSLVAKIAPTSRAAEKIRISDASRKPNHATDKLQHQILREATQLTQGGNCASSHSFTLLTPDDLLCDVHIAVLQ